MKDEKHRIEFHIDTSFNAPHAFGYIRCVNTGGSWRATLRGVLAYIPPFLLLWGAMYCYILAVKWALEA